MQVTQRPTFIFHSDIGDRAVFSGFAKLEPLTATLDAMLDDIAFYETMPRISANRPRKIHLECARRLCKNALASIECYFHLPICSQKRGPVVAVFAAATRPECFERRIFDARNFARTKIRRRHSLPASLVWSFDLICNHKFV